MQANTNSLPPYGTAKFELVADVPAIGGILTIVATVAVDQSSGTDDTTGSLGATVNVADSGSCSSDGHTICCYQ